MSVEQQEARVMSYGRTHFRVDRIESPAEWAEGLRHANVAGVSSIAVGQTSVLVGYDPSASDRVRTRIASVQPSALAPTSNTVRIPTKYGGPGLAAAAAHLGFSEESVVFRHRSSSYTALFCVTHPGRWFLDGLDPSLNADDLSSPSEMMGGRISLVGSHCVIDPPGVHRSGLVIATTDVSVWNLLKEPPSLLRPGTRVQFEET